VWQYILHNTVNIYRKKKKRKTFSGTKEPYYNLASPVITLTYWRYVAVRMKKGIAFTDSKE